MANRRIKRLSLAPIMDVGPKAIGHYAIGPVIGRGAFSTVRLAQDNTDNRVYACKMTNKSKMALKIALQRFEDEIRISHQVQHPGVVRFRDILEDDNFYFVMYEYCSKGSLLDLIVKNGKLSEEDARQYSMEILTALKYMHDSNMVHRDIKPDNVLIDNEGRLRLTDFGFSRVVGDDGMVDLPYGTVSFASPQCLSGKPYNAKKNDMWSFGVMVYSMCTGKLPWTSNDRTEMTNQIEQGKYRIWPEASDDLKDFLHALICVDEEKRLSAGDALCHPWVVGSEKNEECVYWDAAPFVAKVSLKGLDQFFKTEVDVSSLANLEVEEEKPWTFEAAERAIKRRYEATRDDEDVVANSEIRNNLSLRRAPNKSAGFKLLMGFHLNSFGNEARGMTRGASVLKPTKSENEQGYQLVKSSSTPNLLRMPEKA